MKNVKWTDFERVDSEDIRALSDLKDLDLLELMAAAMEPGDNGRVLQGFTAAAPGGLGFAITGPSSAIASDGSYMSAPGTTTTLTLSPSTTNYIHAYVVQTDADADNRRFVDPVTGTESVGTVYTRLQKVVNYYVFTSASPAYDPAHPLANFKLDYVTGGVTYQVVPLYAVETDGAGVLAAVDCRPLWGIAANPALEASTDTQDLPYTFTGASITGVRTALQGLAQAVRGIVGGSHPWWEATSKTLQDLVDFLTTAHAWEALQTFKGVSGDDNMAMSFSGTVATRKFQAQFGPTGANKFRVFTEGGVPGAAELTYNSYWLTSTGLWNRDNANPSFMLKFSAAGTDIYSHTGTATWGDGDWNLKARIDVDGLATLVDVVATSVLADSITASTDLSGGAVKVVGAQTGLKRYAGAEDFKAMSAYDTVALTGAAAELTGVVGPYRNIFSYPSVLTGATYAFSALMHLPVGAVITNIKVMGNNNAQAQGYDSKAHRINLETGACTVQAYDTAVTWASGVTSFDLGHLTADAFTATDVLQVTVHFPSAGTVTAAQGMQFRGIVVTYGLPAGTAIVPVP